MEQTCLYLQTMGTILLWIAVGLFYACSINGQATTIQTPEQSSWVEGPATFVTDGTRALTLTYHINTTVSGNYIFWLLPGSGSCSPKADTCTFRPTLKDDGKIVNCSILLLLGSSYKVLSQASYNINLSYPPPSSPNITLSSHTTQPLKQGDVITCSVSGGKPRVTNVTFHCQKPDHADQEDDVSDDGSTVSSNITVDTSNATEQDMTCSCSAFWEPEPSLYQKSSNMTFQLEYPPPSSPNITLAPNTTEPLKQGDVITCSVSGGKPRVTSVTFHCQNPDLADQEDDISDDGSEISSKITVDTSTATVQDMTCICSAFWEPEPGLYQNTTYMTFQLEYKASVTSFSVNGTEKLTVNDTDRSTVAFACDGVGRPSPVLRLYKKGNQAALVEINKKEDKHQAGFTIEASYADMGTYMCEADNSFPKPDQKTVQLFVNCKPERMDNDDETDPPVISSDGHTFVLVGYPSPTVSVISFLGKKTGSGDGEAVSENAFSTQCSRNASVEYLVDCEVTPLEIPGDRLGIYSLNVSNQFGSLELPFRVTSAVTQEGDQTTVVIVISTVVPLGSGVIAVAVVLVVVRRRRRTKNKHQTAAALWTTTQNTVAILPTDPHQHGSPYSEVKDAVSVSSGIAVTAEYVYTSVEDQRYPSAQRSTNSFGYAIAGNVNHNTIVMASHHESRVEDPQCGNTEASPYASID